MKKYNEILELLKAGYTRDEINAMSEDTNEQPEQEPEQEEQTVPDWQQTLNSYLEKIDARLMDLQAANIYNAQQPDTVDHPKTAEEALTELIRPQRRRANKKEED